MGGTVTGGMSGGGSQRPARPRDAKVLLGKLAGGIAGGLAGGGLGGKVKKNGRKK
jgi:hypothetical protein